MTTKTRGAAAFGERLRAWRDRAKLTQKELERRSGIDRQTISDLENGRGLIPRGDEVAAMARALGCSPNDLLGVKS